MDDPNITMEEYIRLKEEKAQRHGRTFNWKTATFGKVENYEDEDDCFIDFETEFPAIVFDNTLTSDTTLLCAPTVSPPNKNKIDFRISLDESDDEDYTPSSPELTVDLDYFKDFKNEFPAIVYNDGLTSKSNLEIEPPVSSGHINKFETSLSKYDEEERNALHVTFPDNLKTIKDSNDNIYITHPSGFGSEVEDGVYWGRGLAGICDSRLEVLFGIRAPLAREFILEFLNTCRMSDTKKGLDVDDTLCFQLGGVRRRMTWRQFILALGLHTEQEMAMAGFRAYWDGSDRLILDKGDLKDYWIEISSDRDFFGPAPSYVLI
ncbi:hypothetical protein Tco_0583027 [Tanacetum coccineum]